mmetsp:Transcript_31163/g.119890  ORF Transcript_31163/g.119890 Transcript_31163/m.119890 type:complete len:132 (+) Transcript_31163:2352-2747(+)
MIFERVPKVPSASSRLAELSLDAGVPPGVFNIVHGRRRTVESLISRDEIKAVSFVGSTEVGTSVYTSATARGKRAQCNLGAKNHAVVMPDADPMQAAKQIVGAAFGMGSSDLADIRGLHLSEIGSNVHVLL